MNGPKRIRVLGLCACLTGFASAHVSDGTTLYHGVRGDYELWVTSRGGTPVTGTHHLKVTVMRAADKGAVPNAEVNLTLVSPEGDLKTYGAVPGTLAYFFELDAPLTQPGRWRLDLDVEGALGREEAAFTLRVFTPLQLGLRFSALMTALVTALALLGFGKLDALRRLAGPEYVGRRVVHAVTKPGWVRTLQACCRRVFRP